MLKVTFSYKGSSLADVLIELAVRFILNCPPQDLNKPERLFFQVEEAHWFYEDFARVDHPALPSLKIKAFVDRLFKTVPLLYQYSADPLAGLDTFKTYKSVIPVRGGIILNDDMTKILMVRAWKSHSWGFPGGKINKDEPDDKCAVREVLEETGFDVSPYLRQDDYIEVTRDNKNIRLYVARGIPESSHFETQTRKEISEIAWHNVSDLPMFSKKRNGNVHYYMAAPFMRGLKNYITKAKGLVSQLSAEETVALKNLLGVANSVNDDEESAQRLLQIVAQPQGVHTPQAAQPLPPLQAPQGLQGHPVPQGFPLQPLYSQYPQHPQPQQPQQQQPLYSQPAEAPEQSDRQLLLDLIKGGRRTQSHQQDLAAAQQILGLLQGEIATQKVLERPAKIIVPAADSAPVAANAPAMPQVPPNSMLQSLLSSRKSAGGSSLLSVLGGEKPRTNKQSLLGLLKPQQQAPKPQSNPNSLMGLLNPSKAGAEEKPSQTNLMDLLKPTPAAQPAQPEAAQPEPVQPQKEQDRPETTSDSSDLMRLLQGPARVPSPPKSDLMDLLKPAAPSSQPATAAPDAPETTESNLLDLLKPKQTSEPKAEPLSEPQSKPQPSQAKAELEAQGASLMSLLGKPSSQSAPAPTPVPTHSSESADLMSLLGQAPAGPAATSAPSSAAAPSTAGLSTDVTSANDGAGAADGADASDQSLMDLLKPKQPPQTAASLMDLLTAKPPVAAPAATKGTTALKIDSEASVKPTAKGTAKAPKQAAAAPTAGASAARAGASPRPGRRGTPKAQSPAAPGTSSKPKSTPTKNGHSAASGLPATPDMPADKRPAAAGSTKSGSGSAASAAGSPKPQAPGGQPSRRPMGAIRNPEHVPVVAAASAGSPSLLGLLNKTSLPDDNRYPSKAALLAYLGRVSRSS